MTSRRRFLKRAGIVTGGVAIGSIALPAPQMSDVTVEGIEHAKQTEPELPWDSAAIESDDATAVVRHHYKPTDEGYVATAPINVVFHHPAGVALDDVMSVLEDADWVNHLEEYVRYAWDRNTEEYVRQQATAAETYYGTNGRLHVRCWEFEGVVSMQAHEDTGAYPNHGIASYETAREAIESLYDSVGWNVATAALDLQNEQPPDHDGKATVITPIDTV